MSELTFDVSIDEDGRYVAEARGAGIATDGATWDEMKANVHDLIAAYYENGDKPSAFHLIREEVLAVA